MKFYHLLCFSVIPFDSAVNIIDCFFYDGAKVVFQVSLAVLECNRERLASVKDDSEAMSILSEYLDSVANPRSTVPLKSVRNSNFSHPNAPRV